MLNDPFLTLSVRMSIMIVATQLLISKNEMNEYTAQ